jgi:hypothetical protein
MIGTPPASNTCSSLCPENIGIGRFFPSCVLGSSCVNFLTRTPQIFYEDILQLDNNVSPNYTTHSGSHQCWLSLIHFIIQEGPDLLHPNPRYAIHLGLTGMGGQTLDLVIEIWTNTTNSPRPISLIVSLSSGR